MEVLTLNQVRDILYKGASLDVDSLPLDAVRDCYDFLKEFAADKVIYGINTGFGPMAQWRVDDRYLEDLQYNIIRSHSCGAGEALEDIYVKSAMIARLGVFLQCRSGIHPEVCRLLVEFINRGIYPYIPMHGSVGASGDLVQLAHLALTLIGEGKVHYRGEWRKTAEVMEENGLKPISIHVREGLSVTNGTSVMTGISVVNQFRAEQLTEWALLASVMMNEIASSFDDLMSEELNSCRRHHGQIAIAAKMRELASGSACLLKREHELYDNSHAEESTFEHKVQAYYSLRCTPQILGPVFETLENSRRVLQEELNCASDNPIIDPVGRNVLHGGNFHGDYISLEEDKVKIAMVRLAMTAERQLNYLFHDRINGILPPFLNLGTLGLNYGMQACQFTATSTTAECQTLAMPNYVHSIPNNNDNQDIVSMGTNTALLCIALAQAIDCLQIKDKIAPASRRVYDAVRDIMPTIVEDKPFYENIAKVEAWLKEHPLDILDFDSAE